MDRGEDSHDDNRERMLMKNKKDSCGAGSFVQDQRLLKTFCLICAPDLLHCFREKYECLKAALQGL